MSPPTAAPAGPLLSLRDFAAITLAILAGATTMLLVSLLLAPAIFQLHLNQVVEALADRDRLTEVVYQLLHNALAHCAPGDTVSLAVLRPGDSTGLVVSDSGAGFDPADTARIFDRFHRADSAHEHPGSGIGLTIARALTTAQGGTLTASSRGPGRGATFTLTLPVAP